MKEHCKLEISQVQFGEYSPDHPEYANMLWCGISHFSEDKVQKLNMKTDEVRSAGRGNYFPIFSQMEKQVIFPMILEERFTDCTTKSQIIL